MLEYDRQEAAYRRRTYYHNAHYSLDRGDGIEYDALFVAMTPCEIYERKVTMEQLHAAIAKSEGVSIRAVSDSIQHGLRNMEKYLKKVL